MLSGNYEFEFMITTYDKIQEQDKKNYMVSPSTLPYISIKPNLTIIIIHVP